MWSSIQWTDLPYVYKYIRLREILRHYSKFKFWHFTWVCNRSVCVNILAVISECFLMCLNLSRGFWHRCRSSNVFTQTTFSDWPDHFLMVGRCVWIYQGALLIALWSCNIIGSNSAFVKCCFRERGAEGVGSDFPPACLWSVFVSWFEATPPTCCDRKGIN